MTNATKDFRNAEILDLGNGIEIVSYPAYDYIHSNNADQPVCADKGGRHLGEATAGIAVAFPSRSHGLLHHHFGLGVYDADDSWGNKAGEVYAYGKGASITSHKRAKETLAAAHLGDTVLYNGTRYVIERRSNDNIALVEA